MNPSAGDGAGGPGWIPRSPIAFARAVSRPYARWAIASMSAVLVATAASRVMTYTLKLLTDAAIAFGQGRGDSPRSGAGRSPFPACTCQRGGLADERLLWHALDHRGGGRGQPAPLRLPLGPLGDVLRRPLRGRARQQDRERRFGHRTADHAVALAILPVDRGPRAPTSGSPTSPTPVSRRPAGLDGGLHPGQRVLGVQAAPAELRLRRGLLAPARPDGGHDEQHRRRAAHGRGGLRARAHRRVDRPPARVAPARVVVVGVAAGDERRAARPLHPLDVRHRDLAHLGGAHQRRLAGHGGDGGHRARAADVLPRAEPDPGRELPRPGREGLAELLDRTRSPTARGLARSWSTTPPIRFESLSSPTGTRACSRGTSISRSRGGEKLGLVGHSGAGKSTLVSLLLRQFELDGGSIRIDGQSVSDITLDSLRRAVALVPQTTSLFHRSILDNIRYGRLEASDEEVMAAARLAEADAFIRELPQGYDTKVGERGSQALRRAAPAGRDRARPAAQRAHPRSSTRPRAPSTARARRPSSARSSA